jgi:2-keto-4-pentenoate hydratase/2-oxohepta-3-ene-1,7-dioic acid hydratase in catechol pathway
MLVSFSEKTGAPAKVGLVSEDDVFDLSGQYSSIRSFLEAFPQGWTTPDVKLEGRRSYPLDQIVLNAPVDPSSSFFAVGANYRSHAAEAGISVPSQPAVFTKTMGALVGAQDPIVLPPISKEMDYEGELAVFIGRRAERVSAKDAMDYVGGYGVVNDVTARDLQWMQLGNNRIVDWLSSKGLERSTPLGPGIVSVKQIPDPKLLTIKTSLNGELMQNGATADMVFDISALIEFISARVALNVGDVIATGTPVGVGGFRKIFLKDGDKLIVEIEGVGRIENIAEQR